MASTDQTVDPADAPKAKKSSKVFLLLLVATALAGMSAGYFGAISGLLPVAALLGQEVEAEPKKTPPGIPDIAFVELPTLTASLPPGAQAKTLRFSSQIEVPSQYEDDVRLLMPRILDLLNGYLRVLDAPDIEGPAALIKLRAQMLRRIELIVGRGRVNNLLVTEFILN